MIRLTTDLGTLQQAQTALEIFAIDLKNGGAPVETYKRYEESAKRLQAAITLAKATGGAA